MTRTVGFAPMQRYASYATFVSRVHCTKLERHGQTDFRSGFVMSHFQHDGVAGLTRKRGVRGGPWWRRSRSSQRDNPRDAEARETHQANGRASRRPQHPADRDDRPGKPREGRARRQAGLRLYQQLAGAARSIAERVDALAAETLPGLQRSVKWGMAWYGVGDGWCFACGGFAGHVKLTFGRGTSLTPVPPVTPIGMGKDSRGVDLESVDDLDEARSRCGWSRRRHFPVSGTMRTRSSRRAPSATQPASESISTPRPRQPQGPPGRRRARSPTTRARPSTRSDRAAYAR